MARSDTSRDEPEAAETTDGPGADGIEPESDPSPPDELQDGSGAASPGSCADGAHPQDADADVELLRELDDFLADIDREFPASRERATPEDHYRRHDRLGGDTRAQSTVGVDHVREDGIAVDGDSYVGLLEVTPRNWLSLDEQERETVMASYMSFLLSLKWPIAIVCYPREFDLGDHLEQFYEAGTRPGVRDESPLLQYGRKYYVDWADRRVDGQNIKRRAFYIVVRVDADHVHADLDSGSVLSRLPLVGSGLSWLRGALPGGGSEAEERAREELCVREVRKRQKALASNLGRTGVGLDVVRDRQETMTVLYHYYNHVDPLFETFDHATTTGASVHADAARETVADGGTDE